MFSDVLKIFFGSRNDRLLKQYRVQVNKINALEPAMKALSDEALRAKTAEYKVRVEKAKRWTRCCRKPTLPCEKQVYAC